MTTQMSPEAPPFVERVLDLLEARQRRVDGIMLVPVQAFLDGLWSGDYA